MRLSLIFVLGFMAQTVSWSQSELDRDKILYDLQVISEDSMQGRGVGTPGGAKARKYILQRFDEVGLTQFNETFEYPFEFEEEDDFVSGVNILGYIPGESEKCIVITAHYDHLGIQGGQIFNGADDNASGVTGIIHAARNLARLKPKHTLIFAALDGEEHGLQGARAFVESPVVPMENLIFNINLDMISHNDNNEIYAAGSYHYPQVKTLVESIRKSTSVDIKLGHDSPDLGHNDWTNSSDHGPFHENGIPFIYYGVEDHEDYHKPTDEFNSINQDFFVDVVGMVIETIKVVDQALD